MIDGRLPFRCQQRRVKGTIPTLHTRKQFGELAFGPMRLTFFIVDLENGILQSRRRVSELHNAADNSAQ
jgi:hypothetical protein